MSGSEEESLFYNKVERNGEGETPSRLGPSDRGHFEVSGSTSNSNNDLIIEPNGEDGEGGEDNQSVWSSSVSHSSHEEEESQEASEITLLSIAFRNLMDKISSRVQYLAETTHKSVSNSHKLIENDQIAQADRQIKQLEEVIAQCDGLESELLKIRQIGEIASAFKLRIQVLERQLSR
jgi:hypothetical protein